LWDRYGAQASFIAGGILGGVALLMLLCRGAQVHASAGNAWPTPAIQPADSAARRHEDADQGQVPHNGRG
jgi:hypothetical protein